MGHASALIAPVHILASNGGIAGELTIWPIRAQLTVR
jgi:hypothetical protein